MSAPCLRLLLMLRGVVRASTTSLSDQASIQTPGVLLIDEVDMHLHPRWQQQVLGLLRDAFPALQTIVTTHSPHVLSTVEKSSIRVLHIEDDEVIIETPLMQTRGVESSGVLESVMKVDPVPQLEEFKGTERIPRSHRGWKGRGARSIRSTTTFDQAFRRKSPGYAGVRPSYPLSAVSAR